MRVPIALVYGLFTIDDKLVGYVEDEFFVNAVVNCRGPAVRSAPMYFVDAAYFDAMLTRHPEEMNILEGKE